MLKKALAGITGQDGVYLGRFLRSLNEGHEVNGIKRHTSLLNTTRIDNIDELVPERVESDYQVARQDGLIRAHGFEAYYFHHESTELAFQKELF